MENQVDLFDDIESLPKEVRDILEAFCEMSLCYDNCRTLIDELEKVGYSCEYGLDAVPYNLHKINLVVSN